MFYVYTHWHYDTGVPVCFWVGKGCRDRAWSLSGRNDMWKRVAAKHGYDVRIVQECETEEEALGWEKTFITLFGRRDRSEGTLVNFTDGGEGLSGYRHTAESKAKASASLSGRKLSADHCKKLSVVAKNRTPEHTERLAKASRGRKASEETRARISASGKGRKHSQQTKDRIGMANSLRVITPETRAKLVVANLGKVTPVEVRAKISAGGKGKKRSSETRERMAEAARNRTPEHREKLLLARRARI